MEMKTKTKFNDIIVSDYTERSIVVQGDTRKYKEDLKKLGGKYNGKLKNGPGWIFPKTSKDEVDSFINNGKRLVSDEEAKEGEERSQRRAREFLEREMQKTVNRSPTQSVESVSPNLLEYTTLVNMIKNISIEVNRINHAISVIMSDEQKKILDDVLNKKKSVIKKVFKRNTESNVEDGTSSENSDESSDEVPHKRLLK